MIKELDNPVLPPDTTLPESAEDAKKRKQAEAQAKKKKASEDKARRKAAMFKPFTSKTQVKHEFTEAERLVIGAELSRHLQEGADLDNQKKAIVKDFGSRLEAKKAEVAMASNKIANGYEMRDTEVMTFFRKSDKKRYLYNMEGEFVRSDDMQPADWEELFLPELLPSVAEGEDLPKKYLAKALENIKRK